MSTHTRYVYRLWLPVVFEAGLAPGAGKNSGNMLVLSRDGRGRPLLRGSTIAGVLRHAWAHQHGYRASPLGQDPEVARWFGFALGDDDSEAEGHEHRNLPSPLRVADALVETGESDAEMRQHNAVDRHTGAVREGGLFTLEALPPGSRATLLLSLHLEDESGAREFCSELVGLVEAGLVFGGHAARGVGLARLREPARWRRFDLGSLEDYAAWLNESWRRRAGLGVAEPQGEVITPAADARSLRVSLLLTVPRGQDICIGSGMGDEFPIEPQQVTAADGRRYWRLPGSTLRGIFRGWFSRLAARAAHAGGATPPADSANRFLEGGRRPARGDQIGWLFHSDQERTENVRLLAADELDLDEVVECSVDQLFGSLYNAGRIHISDAISEEPVAATGGGQLQHRRHVAVDRVTGGASEGFLFDHGALLPGPRFRVEVAIRDATLREAQWLRATLHALHTGLIRVGSSKSSGRLALAAPPSATGRHAEVLNSLQFSEVSHG